MEVINQNLVSARVNPLEADKLRYLEAVRDIALTRDSSLLPYAVPGVLEFQFEDGYPAIKRLVLGFLEDAVRRDTIYLPSLLDSMIHLSEDENEGVILKVFQINNALYKRAVKMVAAHQGPASGLAMSVGMSIPAKDLWERLQLVKQKLLNYVHSDHEVVRCHALKLYCMLILIYSEPTRVARGPRARAKPIPDQFTVADIPLSNAVIDRVALKREGEDLLKFLGDLTASGGGHRISFSHRQLNIAVNSVSLIAAHRPYTAPRLCPVLGEVLKRLRDFTKLSPSQQKSLALSTRCYLLKLLRSPAMLEHAELLVAILREHGVNDQAERAKHYALRMSGYAERIIIDERASKRQRLDPASMAYPPSPNTLRIDQDIRTLPLDGVIDLIIANMHNIPGPPPEDRLRHTRPRPVEQILETIGSAEPGSDGRPRDPRLRTAPPSESTFIFSPQEAQMVASRLRQALSVGPTIQRTGAQPGVATRDVGSSTSRPQSAISTATNQLLGSSLGANDSRSQVLMKEGMVGLNNDNQVVVKVPNEMKPEVCKKMAQWAFHRICRGRTEKGAIVGGRSALRDAVISRMACNEWLASIDSADIESSKDPALSTTWISPVTDKLITHIVADAHGRYKLALSLLYQEFANQSRHLVIQSSEGPSATLDRYSRVLNRFLRKLKGTLDPSQAADKKLFRDIISQLPQIIPGVFEVVKEYVEDPEGTNLGILTLRDIVFQRPLASDAALRLLLLYASAPAEEVREKSIRCIANQLFKKSEIVPSIERAAVALLSSMVEGGAITSIALPPDQTPSEPKSVMISEVEVESGMVKNGVQVLQSEALAYRESLDACSPSRLYDGMPTTHEEVKARLDLYLAVCTKNVDLLTGLAEVYTKTNEIVQAAFVKEIERLIRTLDKAYGAADVLKRVIHFAEEGLPMVFRIVEILSQSGRKPEQKMVDLLRERYMEDPTKLRLLVPVLHAFETEELERILPSVIALSPDIVWVGFSRLVDQNGSLSAAELLVLLHRIEAPLRDVVEARKVCFDHPHVFNRHVIEAAIKEMLGLNPIPRMTLSTVMAAISIMPKLKNFAAQALSQLVDSQVWEQSVELWTGVKKCFQMIQPLGCIALTKLPVDKLSELLEEGGEELRHSLRRYCESVLDTSVKQRPDIPDYVLELAGVNQAENVDGQGGEGEPED